MKYEVIPSRLSKAEREVTNSRILENLHQIPPEEVFNSYTNLGGLHGLKMADFDSFHDYTEAKKEFELGQFFTPPLLCDQIIQSLKPTVKMQVADLTCGSGNFFNSLPVESNCHGIELEENAYKVARRLYPDANIIEGDFCRVYITSKMDMVVGNPPFNLATPDGISQLAYMEHAWGYLKPARVLCFLAPKSFLEDDFQNKTKRAFVDDKFNFLCQAVIPRSWFDVDIDIKVMYFQKVGVHRKAGYSNTYVEFDPASIHEIYIKPCEREIKEHALRLWKKQKLDSEMWREMIKYGKQEITMRQLDRIKKYSYEIMAHPQLRKKYFDKALDKLQQFREQEKGEMDYLMWMKVKISADEVINQLRKWVRTQSRPEPHKEMKLVKQRNAILYKAYSKARKAEEKRLSINEIVLRDKPYKGRFSKLLDRKKRDYRIQNTPMLKLERDARLDKFLREFELREVGKTRSIGLFDDGPVIRLNDKQFQDLGLALQKRYSILAWEMGSGKSVAGMAWLTYVKPMVHTTFICAPSLAVQLTWKPRLEKYGFHFVIINQWQDLSKLKRGKIALISYDMIRILQSNNGVRRRHVRNFIKKQAAYSIACLFDESDELSNITSGRTRGALECFRRAKFKILTTGTTTRNNINELYPQLELLYNNSVNMINWAPSMFRPDKDGELIEQYNDRSGQPFPAWRGHNDFKYTHCPQRTTVFGVKQDTQDIYNATFLKDLIDKTILTRTFDDVVGKRIYEIKSHHVIQGPEEHQLYGRIIDRFWELCYNYFQHSGNERKEAMQRLMRQIRLLIRATSTPHCFEDYEGNEKPMKFYKILDMLKEWKDEKVAIGTVSIEAAREYTKFLQFHLADRAFFFIIGEVSFSKRKKIIEEFQATTNGILISTQESLKSSVDIETCNRCILEALQWNLAKMRQYYFRFIRYNSKEKKEIHFVTYENSVEQNLLALLMSKEKLNEFVKDTSAVKSRDDIMQEYDVDPGILNQLIVKEYDDKGRMHLRWGNSKIQ